MDLKSAQPAVDRHLPVRGLRFQGACDVVNADGPIAGYQPDRAGHIRHIDGAIAGAQRNVALDARHLETAVAGPRLEINFSRSLDKYTRLVAIQGDMDSEP